LRRRSQFTVAAVAVLLSLIIALTGSSAAQTVSPSPEPAARIVVLVDESLSLSEEAVRQERDAVALLAVSELSERSEMAILGFGSSNGQGQQAVTRYCGFIALDAPETRQALADCGREIHRRGPSEGADTDHVAALQAAVELLGNQAGSDNRSRIILLLTDGVLDVRNSPQYGPEQDRQAEAQRRLVEEWLPEAKSDGIQIWPIGFGEASRADLDRFARGGASGTELCGFANVPEPRAIIATSVDAVTNAALEALASAECFVSETPVSGQLPPGGTLSLTVVIPAIASKGAISVTKGDPRVRVTYVDPDGVVVAEALAVSRQESPVEALRLDNPKPGTWTVILKAPPGTEPALVTARALWQGFVRSAIQLEPQPARPGDRVVVKVVFRTGSELVTDGSSLGNLQITADVYGEDFSLPVPLADDGVDPDAQANDATLTGAFTIPDDASGDATVTARVAGPGIVEDDQRPFSFVIQTERFLSVQVTLPDLETVAPGQAVQGTITAINEGDPVTAHLALTELPESARVRIAPADVELPAGQSEQQFTIAWDPTTPLGQVSGVVEVTNDNGDQLQSSVFVANVARPARPVDYLLRVWPWLAGILALAAIAAVAWMLQRSMRNVQFVLRDHTGGELDYEKIKGHRTKLHLGVLPVDDHDPKRLRLRRSAVPDGMLDVLTIARGDGGFLVKRASETDARRIDPGGSVAVGDDLEVQINDPRGGRAPDQRSPASRATGSRSASGEESGSNRGGRW